MAVIVFDLDDTLYLERDFAFSGYDHLEGIVRAETGVVGFAAACRRRFELGERQRIFNQVCGELGLEVGPAYIRKLVDAYRFHRPNIALCPDVVPFFGAYSGPFGLITDGPEQMQRNKIAALGLDEWIAYIQPTGAWPEGYGKPHHRAYAEMEVIAQPEKHMVYVADNPAKDFVTPKTRGWLTIQITRPGAVHDPNPPDQAHAAELVIESLTEFPLSL